MEVEVASAPGDSANDRLYGNPANLVVAELNNMCTRAVNETYRFQVQLASDAAALCSAGLQLP